MQFIHTGNEFLENNLSEFDNCSGDDLIIHAIKAMKKSQDIELTNLNIDISIVGKDTKFTKLSEDDVQKYLDKLKNSNNNVGSGMEIDS